MLTTSIQNTYNPVARDNKTNKLPATINKITATITKFIDSSKKLVRRKLSAVNSKSVACYLNFNKVITIRINRYNQAIRLYDNVLSQYGKFEQLKIKLAILDCVLRNKTINNSISTNYLNSI